MKLADTGIFWTGTERKTMPYGTIHVGQMFVQYFEPAQQRHPLPVVLVHGGGGQSVHYMGLGGASGWAHHFVQAGYKVYLIDRPKAEMDKPNGDKAKEHPPGDRVCLDAATGAVLWRAKEPVGAH